jgi:hypothetical protein
MASATVPEPEPERVLRVSQEAFSERVQLNVPAPVFEITRFCAVGLLPP